MEIITLPLGPLETNCYIIYNEDKKAIVFDPSYDGKKILSEIKSRGLEVEGIFLTHTHFDHIGALNMVAKDLDVMTYLGGEEYEWIENPALNGSSRYGESVIAKVKREEIKEGSFETPSFKFEVLATPGHSPGSKSYVFDNLVISGDVLFNKGVGRTDLYMGNEKELMHSIKEKLFKLDEDMDVYPGHGMPTTIIEEMYENPYIK
ncbi:MBL fold metallo-hydrolase [Phocicoccus pinnipedialis]|uniref:Putative metallo-hydrolase n=1 Tax=Phocicoccus pinnipedialis TaxID=110845 RepID=A0A6V7REA5_9BACL|nr:MBL fold metallo-hydrolase [Jeotgalicoccus pinnipedialis]MBP1939299.1 glyoxylase-like metal-dependent hydrolase (beta-lactamase superfamily II) [Jeotgalicoccus pinnipedialis]CAD2075976.1 putative metallo-hydrolase [Jeotgalicoccus pinnipedialis]